MPDPQEKWRGLVTPFVKVEFCESQNSGPKNLPSDKVSLVLLQRRSSEWTCTRLLKWKSIPWLDRRLVILVNEHWQSEPDVGARLFINGDSFP